MRVRVVEHRDDPRPKGFFVTFVGCEPARVLLGFARRLYGIGHESLTERFRIEFFEWLRAERGLEEEIFIYATRRGLFIHGADEALAHSFPFVRIRSHSVIHSCH